MVCVCSAKEQETVVVLLLLLLLLLSCGNKILLCEVSLYCVDAHDNVDVRCAKDHLETFASHVIE